jgi:hypothetical protein
MNLQHIARHVPPPASNMQFARAKAQPIHRKFNTCMKAFSNIESHALPKPAHVNGRI